MNTRAFERNDALSIRWLIDRFYENGIIISKSIKDFAKQIEAAYYLNKLREQNSDILHSNTVPYYVKSIVNPDHSWKSYNQAHQLCYTMELPNTTLEQWIFKSIQPSFVNPFFELSLLSQTNNQLFHEALQYWENIVNVKFIETTRNISARIFGFDYINQTADNEKVTTGFAFAPTIDQQGNVLVPGVGFNINLLSKVSPALKLNTFHHEIAHWAFGFKHPFESPYILKKSHEQTQCFSIMNYAYEKINRETLFHPEILKSTEYHIVPITPMPSDIEAAEFVVGRNELVGDGDTEYKLNDYVISTPDKIMTISTIVDRNGIDTLSAKDEESPVTINLRRGHHERSHLKTGLIVLSHNTDIENVICGKNQNKVVLNELPNIVYIPKKATADIIVDPQNTGHDTIIGFNGRLILESTQKNVTPKWNLSLVGGDEIKNANKTLSYQYGTKVSFDKNNSVTLVGIKPKEIENKNLITHMEFVEKPNETTDSSILDIFSNFPPGLVTEFYNAFARGALFTCLTDLTEESLRHWGCNESQIATVNQVVQSLLCIISGNVLSTTAGFAVSSILRYFGCSTSTCNQASLISSSAVNALSCLSPYGFFKAAASTVGSVLGSGLARIGTTYMKNLS